MSALADALGKPGTGFHAARLPGTPTALWDFVGTVLLAWATSAATGARASLCALAWFAAAEALHALFGVRVAGGR